MKIIGFYRVHGFEHQVRFVTDQKNERDQPLVVFYDGNRTAAWHMFASEDNLQDISELSEEQNPAFLGRSERQEYERCKASIEHGALSKTLDWV